MKTYTHTLHKAATILGRFFAVSLLALAGFASQAQAFKGAVVYDMGGKFDKSMS